MKSYIPYQAINQDIEKKDVDEHTIGCLTALRRPNDAQYKRLPPCRLGTTARNMLIIL